jgi:ADP-ribose pyrophosphatase
LTAFRKLAEVERYRGSLISVGTGTFLDPEGEQFEREIVHHPGAVSMVAIVDDGRSVVLVRQYRPAVGRELLELPAGKRDVVDEPPEITAQRELEEEIGMRAGHLDQLAEFYNSPGFCDERSIVYLARDLEPCTPSAHSVEEKHMHVEHVRLDDVPGLIAAGEIVDAKTIIGLCLVRERAGRA